MHSRTSPFDVRIVSERVVNGSTNLVHSLNIRAARVEFGKYEQDAFDNLPVGLFAIGQVRVLVVVFAFHRVRLEVGKTEPILADLVGAQLYGGYAFAQTLVTRAVLGRVLDLLARKLGRFLEEEQVRTQTTHVLVDLHEHLVVLEERAPLTVGIRIQRL